MEVTITATVFKKQPNGNYISERGEEVPLGAMREIVRAWNETHDNPRLFFESSGDSLFNIVVLEMKGEMPETALSPTSLFR